MPETGHLQAARVWSVACAPNVADFLLDPAMVTVGTLVVSDDPLNCAAGEGLFRLIGDHARENSTAFDYTATELAGFYEREVVA